MNMNKFEQKFEKKNCIDECDVFVFLSFVILMIINVTILDEAFFLYYTVIYFYHYPEEHRLQVKITVDFRGLNEQIIIKPQKELY